MTETYPAQFAPSITCNVMDWLRAPRHRHWRKEMTRRRWRADPSPAPLRRKHDDLSVLIAAPCPSGRRHLQRRLGRVAVVGRRRIRAALQFARAALARSRPLPDRLCGLRRLARHAYRL